MEFGASFAYRRIDAHVEATLQEAAQVLEKLVIERDAESAITVASQGTPDAISITQAAHETISIDSILRSSKQPKATIRTPRDSNKNRKLTFPPARIGFKSEQLETCDSGITDSTIDQDPPTPDSLFPSAIYIPAKQKPQMTVSISATTASSCSNKSLYRKHIEKLAIEPLEDIKHLKCRGLKKSKPDDLFPKATYDAGTGKPKMALSPSSMVSVDLSYASTTAKSNSLAYQPMEFVSSDGRVKLWLQPLEKQKKKNSEKSKKRERCIDDAPIPPKQLQSSTKLNIENRTKFSTNLSIGDHVIDLSGILNGSMKKKNLAKLVINGQSYSI
ncbi:Breast cancer type 2 susceptibility protein homolog [Caenorhabditis elegans]|uniref:Breast cancer type 2 susceptibility protein homolog n=1 Tax=Caenorhabditis elegans TaxID=6239 RepID=Q21105_CAEEL|nr:Breast cancer type 2 susceptibility protein homolog [Caenorhabditis elegans]CAA92474.1 Breast cancer type 2 susceptibility protein homolog [Caenorhabditis elegans]|eukprot:NP_501729.1 Uncharacterized protein CELE_K01H12.4 [Caenorhabditis elegans]